MNKMIVVDEFHKGGAAQAYRELVQKIRDEILASGLVVEGAVGRGVSKDLHDGVAALKAAQTGHKIRQHRSPISGG